MFEIRKSIDVQYAQRAMQTIIRNYLMGWGLYHQWEAFDFIAINLWIKQHHTPYEKSVSRLFCYCFRP